MGTYDIVISGGVASNYDFKYTKGTLTVEPNPLGITELQEGKGPSVVYTLDGRKMRVDNPRQLPKGIYIVNGKKVTIQ